MLSRNEAVQKRLEALCARPDVFNAFKHVRREREARTGSPVTTADIFKALYQAVRLRYPAIEDDNVLEVVSMELDRVEAGAELDLRCAELAKRHPELSREQLEFQAYTEDPALLHRVLGLPAPTND